MGPILFLLGLLVVLYAIHRSGRRGRKLNDAIERNRDLRNEQKIAELEAQSDAIETELTNEEN